MQRAFLVFILALAVPASACRPAPEPAPPGPDPELAAVLIAVHAAGLERARFVAERASHPRVRSFAAETAAAYEAAEMRLRAALGPPEIDPQDYPDARRHAERAAERVAAIGGLRGMTLDRAYLRTELEHQRWLQASVAEWLARTEPDSRLRDVLGQLREASATLLDQLEALDSAIVGFHN
jgi:putative membrane protein